METTIDSKFTENTEAIFSQFGFKDLKSFIKNQALLMLMAKIDKYEAENKQYEAKYKISFHDFKKQMEEIRGMEDIEKEEDYLVADRKPRFWIPIRPAPDKIFSLNFPITTNRG